MVMARFSYTKKMPQFHRIENQYFYFSYYCKLSVFDIRDVRFWKIRVTQRCKTAMLQSLDKQSFLREFPSYC